ncbi:MAG: aminotransferase class I/II-fold pyridoxal phosphate-dependent enzyme [Bacteroidota bacterium]
MKKNLKEAYDAEHFRKEGHALIDMLADYLEDMQDHPNEHKAITWTNPEDSLEYWEAEAEMEKPKSWSKWLMHIVDKSVHLHHPHYMGHQISPVLPMSALSGFVSDFLNNGMGVYEMGVVSSTLERVVVERVAKKIGYNDEAGGVLTSGGTLGNLTALLCARSLKASTEVWQTGSDEQLALMVSEEAHYCVDRAARIMGWGEAGIIKVPSNDKFQMQTDLLPKYLKEATEKGIKVIAVVGSACSTSTGSYDDLEAIADFCETNDLWFHVDGAHGAAAIYSEKYKSVVKGIERADSVVLDFHKMLLTPSVTTALVFKKVENSYKTFAQKADYLWNQQEDQEWYNLAKRTFECTKLMMSIKAFTGLRYYGEEVFDEYVTTVMDLGKKLAKLVNEKKCFQLAVEPQSNIVCFRYIPDENMPASMLNHMNDEIRTQILMMGDYYIVKTKINDEIWLRTTLTNAFTTEEMLGNMLRLVEVLGTNQTRSRMLNY